MVCHKENWCDRGTVRFCGDAGAFRFPVARASARDRRHAWACTAYYLLGDTDAYGKKKLHVEKVVHFGLYLVEVDLLAKCWPILAKSCSGVKNQTWSVLDWIIDL